MDKLISDRAQAKISKKVLNIACAYHIDQWQSEPNHQHQNFAKRCIATIEANTNNVLSKSGTPDSTWLLCVSALVHAETRHRMGRVFLSRSTLSSCIEPG
jgi:hypothetical protein